MARKTISFTLIIVLLLLVYQFLFTMVKSSHSITYSISNGDLFTIDEKYTKDDDKDYYLIKVSNKDNKYVFKLDNMFNKQKNIVEGIEKFEQDGYNCIALDLIGTDKFSYPECYKDNITYSYNSIKDKIDFGDFIYNIKDENREKYEAESVKENELGLIVNKGYIDENEIIMVYGYKQIALFYTYYSRVFSFSNMDNYKNNYGTLVGNYYLIPKITSLPTFETYVKYDVIDGIKREINLPTSISKQAYINGVNDNKLYLFDKSNKRQFEIDPYKDNVSIVGTIDEEGITFVDGKKQHISVYDLEKNEVIFENKKETYSNFDGNYLASNDYYTIFTKGNDFYKVYKEFPDVNLLLFSESDTKEIKLKGDNIYFIKENGIYKYNNYGVFGLIFRNEFIYNSDNIYDVYIK